MRVALGETGETSSFGGSPEDRCETLGCDMIRHPGTKPALLPKEHVQTSATAACGSVQRRRDVGFSALKHRASIWWARTARLQPCTTACRAYQARSAESLRVSSRRMLWPWGSCATSCCKIARSGQASAKARMSFRLGGERPVISGKSRCRSGASRSMTPVPLPLPTAAAGWPARLSGTENRDIMEQPPPDAGISPGY